MSMDRIVRQSQDKELTGLKGLRIWSTVTEETKQDVQGSMQ